MGRVLLVLLADELDQLSIRHEALMNRNRPRLGVRFGIVDCYFDVEMTEVGPPVALDDSRFVGERAAFHIQPAEIAEPCRFHHHRVAFPVAYGVAIPPWLGVYRKGAPIGKDLA